MTLSEEQKEGINHFWDMTISDWDKAQRAEINEDFPHLLVLLAITLGDMDKVRWLQEEYGGEEIWRLANLNVTPWCRFVSKQLGIDPPPGPDDDRPISPDSVISISNIRL